MFVCARPAALVATTPRCSTLTPDVLHAPQIPQWGAQACSTSSSRVFQVARFWRARCQGLPCRGVRGTLRCAVQDGEQKGVAGGCGGCRWRRRGCRAVQGGGQRPRLAGRDRKKNNTSYKCFWSHTPFFLHGSTWVPVRPLSSTRPCTVGATVPTLDRHGRAEQTRKDMVQL
jgi:hypothetical protein